MRRIIAALLLILLLSGCSGLPLKEGGLAIGKNTTAGIDDIGVARITNEF